ncbi:hypothetical protein IMG5_016770, partial [Ichthyophthirius multifiliis]
QISDQIENEILIKKKYFKQLILAKKFFYYEILKHGKDNREEGLTWIIHQLQNMGENVNEINLPEFLDMKSKEFLIKKFNKQNEIKELEIIQNACLKMFKTSLKIQEENYLQNLSFFNEDQSTIQKHEFNESLNNNTTLLQFQLNNMFTANNNCFSSVNIAQIKNQETINQKKQILDNMQSSYEGLTQEAINSLESTIDQFIQIKLTSNDIIYNETKKKIINIIATNKRKQYEENQN